MQAHHIDLYRRDGSWSFLAENMDGSMNNFKGMDLNGKEPNSTAGSGSSLVF
jgi:hypothetical protein